METDKTARTSGKGSGPGYETRDANVRGLVIFGLGMFATIALVFVLAASVFRYFAKSQSLGPPASPFADLRTLPPAPRLQVEPREDLEHLRARENEKLNGYGWVDPKAGIVRIPIDHAMDLLLRQGLPVRGETLAKK
jgi:hypothetical protein